MSAADVAAEAMTNGQLRQEIARLQQRVQDLEASVESAYAAMEAEQRSHMAYRLRNPERLRAQPARPVRDVAGGEAL